MPKSAESPFVDDVFIPVNADCISRDRLLNFCNNLVIQLNEFLEITGVSHRLCSMVEMRAKDLIGFSVEKLVMREMCSMLKTLVNHTLMYGFEASEPVTLELIHRQGIPLRVPFRIIPHGRKLQDGVLLVSVENNDNEILDKELIQLQGKANIGELAGEIGHELNNYLLVMSGHAQMFPIHMRKNNTERVHRDVDIILDQVKRMKKLIEGLLDVTRSNGTVESANLNEIILKTIQFIEPQNKVDNINFVQDLGLALPHLHVNPNQIQQILMNLFSNSADAMGKREGEGGKIFVESFSGGDDYHVGIRVTDTGPGIPEKYLEKVFEAKFTTKNNGNGLGLFICKKIVSQHNGKIFLGNSGEQGVGSICTVLLNGY